MAPFATKTIHKEPYDAISPILPEHSQAGQSVMITGGGSGIGFAISRAFAQAGATKIIILGRRVTTLTSAAAKLVEQVPAFKGEVKTVQCDIMDPSSVAALWEGLEGEEVVVDVLVLNAAQFGARVDVLLDAGVDEVWSAYSLNVRANLDLTNRFFTQLKRHPNGKKKTLLNVSTSLIHKFPGLEKGGIYGATKAAFMALLQHIAVQTPVEKVQILSFHPGSIFTNAARDVGFTESSFDWDDDHLPGQFAVWATSSAAAFLHGRFVHANWDVNELQGMEVKKRLEEDSEFLEVGVNGL
ncbi:hypothetical protein AJ80_08556 [Polytolypa hystricis UAMH7299]|uniref:Uncharacterized protein n=1 Tax=Polytolypa hystricis (strain UAMH7299) TaxID=1447883 RepID=A0A2B7X613_POLH7|nr:hypothetical protein AJ80_08556 [Polytolypa hystricis UAMH7299]